MEEKSIFFETKSSGSSMESLRLHRSKDGSVSFSVHNDKSHGDRTVRLSKRDLDELVTLIKDELA